MITPRRAQLDEALQQLLHKIDTGTVSCADFNHLIREAVVGEATPEAIRNRVRRRVQRNPEASHADPATGHQPLQPPEMRERVQPRRAPEHPMSQGRSHLAHRHSARTQAALEFLLRHQGRPLTEALLAQAPDPLVLRAVTGRLLARTGGGHPWLYELWQRLA